MEITFEQKLEVLKIASQCCEGNINKLLSNYLHLLDTLKSKR